MTLSMLNPFIREVSKSVHGARRLDTCRKGYHATDTPSVARLVSAKFRKALGDYVIGRNRDGTPLPGGGHVELTGILSLLGVLYKFLGAFMSRTMSLGNRIEAAGFVARFLMVWQGSANAFVTAQRARTSGSDRMKPGSAFITREGQQDAVMVCHLIPLLIKQVRDFNRRVVILFWKLGSDVCETTFASLGSFIDNKRTYTLLEALQTLRTMVRIIVLGSANNIDFGRRGGKVPDWVEDDSLKGDQLDWPTDEEIAYFWNKGCAAADAELTRLGAKPTGLCISTHEYARTHTHTHIHTYTLAAHMHTHTHTHTHTFTYTHTNTHTHAHTHTQKNTNSTTNNKTHTHTHTTEHNRKNIRNTTHRHTHTRTYTHPNTYTQRCEHADLVDEPRVVPGGVET